MIEALKNPRSWIEIAVLAVAFYFILNFIRGTRGAGILKGVVFLFTVAVLGAMYLADVTGLHHLRDMLTWALSGSALALIVIFAPELRRGLSHLAKVPLLSPLLRTHSTRVVDELVSAAARLSKNRIGALVAVERDVGLGEYVENGVRIDGLLTSEHLESIFYPGNPLHDGAVIVQQDRVSAAACLLPLTDDASLSKSMGTRHRAAIGISEETDAVALVVSEETGRISVAVDGKLTGDLTRESLEKLLGDLISRSERSATMAFRRAREASETRPAVPIPPPPTSSAGGNGSAEPPIRPEAVPPSGPEAREQDL
jgi:diadenylate cyclase